MLSSKEPAIRLGVFGHGQVPNIYPTRIENLVSHKHNKISDPDLWLSSKFVLLK